MYEWHTTNANTRTEYLFGVAFPASAVPESAILSFKEFPQRENDTGSNSYPLFSQIFGRICGSTTFLVPTVAVILISILLVQNKSKLQKNGS